MRAKGKVSSGKAAMMQWQTHPKSRVDPPNHRRWELREERRRQRWIASRALSAERLTTVAANHTIKLVLHDLELLRESGRSQEDDREGRDGRVASGAEERAREVSRLVVVELVLGLILNDVGGETGFEVPRGLL